MHLTSPPSQYSFEKDLNLFQKKFSLFIKENAPHQSSALNEAISYNLFAPGKRLRPYLIFAFARALELNIPENILLSLGLAVEQVHSYSLIHDDLPAMDNADLRRGRTTTHLAFDEATAILAGDALLTDGFFTLSTLPISSEKIQKLLYYLALTSGSVGLIEGQAIDLKLVNVSQSLLNFSKAQLIQHLLKIQFLKTGCLFAFACMAPFFLTEKKGETSLSKNKDTPAYPFLKNHPLYQAVQKETIIIQAAFYFSFYFGLLYQLSDDLMDEEIPSSLTGKTEKIDQKNNKTTFYSLYGKKGLLEEIKLLEKKAISYLDALNIPSSDPLFALTYAMKNRKK